LRYQMKIMIDSSRLYEQYLDFYDDIGFMAALFHNDMLDNADIYEIANRLNKKTPDDVLAKIIANGTDGNNKGLFDNYLNVRGIKFVDSKRALIAKVFYYILHDRIDFYKGIKFADIEMSNYENVITYVGDDVGIEQILGDFYAVDDADLMNEKDVETAIDFVISGLKEYVNEYLVDFPIDNNISQVNKKTVIKTETEEKVKAKALARGIELKNYWDKVRDEDRGQSGSA